MSKYTTEVRFICEAYAGFDTSKGYGEVNTIINEAYPKIFDFYFPIFDASYKSVLCQKILRHYYTREIGFETVGLWKLKLETKLNEIMPYYNKLYESETFRFNPLYDVDYTKEHEGSDSGTEDVDNDHTGTVTDVGTHGGTVGDVGTHTGTIGDSYSKSGSVDDNGTKNTWNVFSDTPQGALTNVANNTYLTDARKIDETDSNDRDYQESGSDTKTFNEGTGNTRTYNETNGNTRTYNESNTTGREFNNTIEYSEHVMGKMGGKSYASMVMEYRQSLLNIDMMIIKDLNELFMLVW